MRQNNHAATSESPIMSFFTSRHLYPAHLSTIKARVDDALRRSGFDHLLVASGIEKMRFLDDMPYPFKANPQFKAWLPLVQDPNSLDRLHAGPQAGAGATTSPTTTGTCRRARPRANGSSTSTSA